MRNPSDRGRVEPFHVMRVLEAAAERQRTHGDALVLCAGQPSTPAPEPALRAAREAMAADRLGYTETAGILPLREAIAAHHRRAGLDVAASDVFVTTGSSGGFVALFLAAFEPGDEVVMARPGYPAYRNTLQSLGCTVIELDCGPEQRFQPTAAQLEALPEPPAGVIVASPANPTGTIIDADELERIARWCAAHDCWLISDEIYHELSYGRPTASAWGLAAPGPDGPAIVVGSVSKFFSMTGYRVGWLLLPTALRPSVDAVTGNLAICPPAIGQHAAIGALSEESRPELLGHLDRYARNRELLLRRLPELGITSFAPPDGAFYAWCEVSHLTDDSLRWCTEALAATGVALTPGIDFDTAAGSAYVRLSFAGATAEIDEAIDRLAAWLN